MFTNIDKDPIVTDGYIFDFVEFTGVLPAQLAPPITSKFKSKTYIFNGFKQEGTEKLKNRGVTRFVRAYGDKDAHFIAREICRQLNLSMVYDLHRI